MTIVNTILIPTGDQFKDWAAACLVLLKKRPSNFLSNGRDSGRNRVAVLLRSSERLNMVLARQLQIELLEEAVKQGVALPCLNTFGMDDREAKIA